MSVAESEPSAAPPRLSSGARGGRWMLAALLGLAVLGFYLSGLHQKFTFDAILGSLDGWNQFARSHLLAALLVYFLVYVVATALSLPAAVLLTLVGGALFGRWLGTAVVSLASTLGATLAFLSSRYLFREALQRRFNDRLEPINRGIEQNGAYYLLTLRLVPAVPFFLINVGMGLTPIRLSTYVFVSWLGMLPATFLYVNAGTALATLDSPSDLVSFKVLGSLALLGIFPLVIRKLIQWRIRGRTLIVSLVGLLLLAAAGLALRTHLRYRSGDEMEVPLREYSNAEYPEDPASRSNHHGQYNGRRLVLVKKDRTHFDFVLEPLHPHIARIVFRDVDVSLMTPSLPEWTKDDDGLRRIALTDRQWNRQEVQFGKRGAEHVVISGGDGFEEIHLESAELAKNCLNAGLWEVLLFTREHDEKTLYYQAWFTFPLGHYKALFEHNTGLAYSKHWYYLEHWFDPAGTPIPLDKLREVVREE